MCFKCGSKWNADDYALKGQKSVIYFVDHAKAGVQVYERKCSSSDCDGILPFDGSPYGLLNYNNRTIVSWKVVYNLDSSILLSHVTFHAAAECLAAAYEPVMEHCEGQH